MKTRLIPNKTFIFEDSKTIAVRIKTCRICMVSFVDITRANRRTLCGDRECFKRARVISATESRDRRTKREAE
jgi:predicted RNA-binding Zn ribbon-like protein